MEKFVLPCLLKNSTKLQQKSMFYGSVIKQQFFFVNSTLESIVSLQNTYISIFIPKKCVYKCPQFSQNSHSW